MDCDSIIIHVLCAVIIDFDSNRHVRKVGIRGVRGVWVWASAWKTHFFLLMEMSSRVGWGIYTLSEENENIPFVTVESSAFLQFISVSLSLWVSIC